MNPLNLGVGYGIPNTCISLKGPCFFGLFGGFHPIREFFTHMDTIFTILVCRGWDSSNQPSACGANAAPPPRFKGP